MDRVIQGALIAVIILGSGYLVYSFVPATQDYIEDVEIVAPTNNTESDNIAKNEIVDFETCVQVIGAVTSTDEYYQYCEVPEVGRFTKWVDPGSQKHLDAQEYELQTFYSPYPYNIVQKIVYRAAGTDEETIVIPNVADVIGESIILSEIAYLKDGSKMYFTDIIPESDAPPSNLYEFDTDGLEFRTLKISKYYSGFGTKALSSDQAQVVVIVDELEEDKNSQKLFLLDLEKDSVKTLVTLSDSETLDYCVPNQCLGEGYGEISWVDDKTVEYAVYDMEKIIEISEYYGERAFIERRQIQIP